MGRKRERVDLAELSAFLESRCEELVAQRREGTASLSRCACRRFLEFVGERWLKGDGLSASLLRDYEEHLHNSHLSRNSVSTYLSNLRSFYNVAVSAGLISSGLNPFLRLHIRPERTHKRPVTLEEIEEIAAMVLEEGFLMSTRDVFVFSILASGIPFIDLAYLTTDNIEGDCLVYHRHKTRVRVSVGITPGMRTILARYAGKGVGKFLFPILKSEDASYTEYRSALKTYNRRLKKISQKMKNPVKLTSYTARHTWATEAKRQNIPIGLISEALGHTSEKTTRYYLDSLGQTALDKANRRIIGELDKLVVRQKKKCPLFMK